MSREQFLVVKRVIDLAIALSFSVIFLPLFIILIFLVRIFLGSPVFFKQRRGGLHGSVFEILKFRTMTDVRDERGELLPDERRLTKFGKFLRASSLDELPELLNIIRGDMSLVGPRPLLAEYLPIYTDSQRRRHGMRPGLTGWAQVKGRNLVDWAERFQLDVWYIDNWTLMLDLRILVVTLVKVLTLEGISGDGHATMPKFSGFDQSAVVGCVSDSKV